MRATTVTQTDILRHQHHDNVYSLIHGQHCPSLLFCLIRWAREVIASASSKFDHVSTMHPFVESSSLSISTRWSHTLDVRYALQRSWCIDEDCHWSFSETWLQIFQIFSKTWWREKFKTPFLTKPSTDFRKNSSDDPQNDQWQSSSMHQDLSNAYLTSSGCDHLVEMIKLELTTEGCTGNVVEFGACGGSSFAISTNQTKR